MRQSAMVPISVQHFDSMWFIEIQVRLAIFVFGRNRLASGVACAVPDGKHGASRGRVDAPARRVVAPLELARLAANCFSVGGWRVKRSIRLNYKVETWSWNVMLMNLQVKSLVTEILTGAKKPIFVDSNHRYWLPSGSGRIEL